MASLPLHATGSTTPLPDVVARDLGDGVPPPVGQPGWWSGSLPQVTPRGTMSPNCGMDYYPPGGFMSYFQAGQQPFPPLHVPFPAPWPPVSKEFQHAPPSSDLGAQPDEARSKGKTKQTRKKGGKTIINIDDGNDVRTAKRLVFEPDEDLRLVSAWLFHSNDPINGNCKKNESYWGDVHAQYNSTTPTNQRRQFYLDDYKEGPFTVLHCWKVLRDEPKWLAILEDQDKSNEMSADDESNKRSLDDGDQLRDISEKERPMGTKEAKKQRNGKGGVKNVDAGLHEELKKYMDIQAGAKQRHEAFIETQRCISSEKVEAAKLRREAALLESYQKLMSMDTKEMTEDMRAEHAIGLKFIREKLVGNTN
ncbi:hypothetical protein HU200_024850 [Digitaria exilis]|uniref:No apical meristem-associated C-terminal domain-containing protein n=1 Tax=Digitaria exilis TaxID=1010633 RepID=A0A835BZ84_9POAL|nr:hypothetical protein HU200_024850 [Digitaria exilis]